MEDTTTTTTVSLLGYNSFVRNSEEAQNFLNATTLQNATGSLFMPDNGPIQELLTDIFSTNGILENFHVHFNDSFCFQDSGVTKCAYLQGILEDDSILCVLLTKADNSTDPRCLSLSTPSHNFVDVSCSTKLRPLCLRGNPIVQPESSPQRLKWKQQKRNRKEKRRSKRGKKFKPEARNLEGRQAEPPPVFLDYCLAALPAVLLGGLLTPGALSGSAVPNPPQQPPPPPPPAPTTPPPILNDIDTFSRFTSQYGRVYSTAAEAAFRQSVFLNNLAIITAQNLLQLGLNHVCVILSHRRDTITSV